jgi:uncharacterized protein (TIGR03083 family)
MGRLPYERYYREIEAEAGALADAARDGDAATPVPTCPEWTLRELAQHVGRAHRWATALVEGRAVEPIASRTLPDRQLPAEEPARSAWLRGGAARLVTAIRDAGPETHVWTWADEQTAGFWARRMTHESVVHRVDAELALGRPVEIAADLAADGISEWLGILSCGPLARTGMRDLSGAGQSLHFHATDPDLADGGLGAAGEWLVRRTPTGIEWAYGHEKADVAVRGPAAPLFLTLMGRLPVDGSGVEVFGDRDLLDHWLANTGF